MNFRSYVDRLQKELQDLPEEEKSLFIEEISTHFTEGLADLKMGKDEPERLERLACEMGNPQVLGRRLKNIHHPNHWLEYLLIVLPGIFVPLLFNFIFFFLIQGPDRGAGNLFIYQGMRSTIFFYTCLTLISLWFYKKQGMVTAFLFWLSSTWLLIFSMFFREKRWSATSVYNQTAGGVIGSAFWGIVLAVLLLGLIAILVNRKDSLLVTLVAIPFLMTVGNLATALVEASGGFPEGYLLHNWHFFLDFGPYQITLLIWPALFLFPKRRIFHWLALAVYAAPVAVLNLIASSHYLHLIIVWAIPCFLVGFNGLSDTIHRRQKSRATQ